MQTGNKNSRGNGLFFEFVDYTQRYRQSTVSPVRNEGYQIIWFLKGVLNYCVDGKPVMVKPGSLLFLNKGAMYQFNLQTNAEMKSILFSDLFFCKTEADSKFLHTTTLFNDHAWQACTHIEPEHEDVLGNLFSQMEEEWQSNKDTLQPDILKNYLHNLLLFSERERNKSYIPKRNTIDLQYAIQFKDLVQAQFQQVKQVIHYASQMGITEKKLSQVVVQELGLSPKAIIDQRTMLEAHRMLTYSAESVKQIAYDLGFEEATNFTKYFRRLQGETPLAYRSRMALSHYA